MSTAAVAEPDNRSNARERNRRAHLTMMALVLVYGLTQILWAEKIPINDGLGWDGEIFARAARDFPGQVLGQQTVAYYMQRIFPSAFVYYALGVLGIPHTNHAIIRAFEVTNLVCLLAAVVFFKSIADSLDLELRSRWLAFVALFGSYCVMKFAFYYPVLTDVFAFAGSMALFAAFLHRRQAAVFATSLLLAFAWPIAPYCGAALLLWPRQPLRETMEAEWDASRFLAAGLAAFSVLLTTYLFFMAGKVWQDEAYYIKELTVPATVLVGLFVYAAFKVLLTRVGIPTVVHALRSIRLRDAALAVALILIVKVTVSTYAMQTAQSWGGLKSFLAFTALLPITKPGVFMIAPVVFFGPVVLLLAVHFPAIARRVRDLGPGFVSVVALNLYLLLTSESRHSLLIFPALVALFAKEIEALRWSRRAHWSIAIASLVFAKWWWQINVEPLKWVQGAEWSFPIQRYFMHLGPWMSPLSLCIQAVATAVVIVIFHRLSLGPGTGTPATRDARGAN